MTFEIKQEYEKCIGCGACVSIDPDNWEFNDDENKVFLKDGKPSEDGKILTKDVEDIGKAQEAADACPVSCIFINEKKSE